MLVPHRLRRVNGGTSGISYRYANSGGIGAERGSHFGTAQETRGAILIPLMVSVLFSGGAILFLVGGISFPDKNDRITQFTQAKHR